MSFSPTTPTTPTTPAADARPFGGVFDADRDPADGVAVKILQPEINRLQTLADEAEAAATHARAQVKVHQAIAAAQDHLARGHRRAADHLRQGLPPIATEGAHDEQAAR